MVDYQGKVAVVTGAASGIGRSLALDFARCGMNVVVADVEEVPLKDLVEEIAALGAESRGSGGRKGEDQGPRALAVHTDVSDLDAVEALADAAFGEFGAVHVLCNNAGVTAGGLPLTEVTHRDWQWVLGVNLWGVVHGVEAFLPRMLAQGAPGHIINTASILGQAVLWPRTAPYVTSKYAVVGLSEALALELEGTNLRVIVICPGSVDTQIYDAERNRPEAFAVNRDALDLRGRMAAVSARWESAEAVSARVLRAMERGSMYVFTDPENTARVDERFDRVRQDYSTAEPLDED